MNRNLVTVAALLLLGCSRDRGAARESSSREADSTAAGGAPVAEARPRSVCSYITEQDATDALGQATKFRAPDAASQHCTLDPASGNVFQGVSVDFRVSRGSTGIYDFLAVQKAAEPLGRLGDKALWLPAGSSRGNLVAVKGTDAVSLTISDFSGKGNIKDRARAFAKRVLERL